VDLTIAFSPAIWVLQRLASGARRFGLKSEASRRVSSGPIVHAGGVKSMVEKFRKNMGEGREERLSEIR
jgi:hypothetical protein